MTSSLSQHGMVLHGLALVHAALRRSLDTIVRVSHSPIPAGDRAAFADFSGRFIAFLHSHHDGEEEIIFPALQRAFQVAGLLEPAAQIPVWRADHEKLLGALAQLESATRAYAGGGPQEPLATAADGVRELLFPHLDAEEKAIDEATFAKAMSGDQAMGLARSASKHGQRHGGPRVLMQFLHGLSDEEQRSHFGGMPWFVRKVLVKRVWERGYRPVLKYAYNQSIAL